ncbi:c-type cytochrome [Pontibacter burrus]|uniref:Cytochrome c n=1 Tax=Pontibacter burrus TaxID=2704466 RepID=A0A6B3LR52_9BACT|nr:cytochrome c [Pontibacter burrus]NEM96686.1 cytochrome c [Pontibacter burrus]
MIKYLLYSSIVLLLIACGTAKRGEPAYAPLATTEPAVVQGKVVFDTFCHKCHPGGEAGLGPAINNKPLPGFLIRFQVRNGLGVMPAFSDKTISDSDLDVLVAYLKTLRKAKEDKPAQAP